MKFFDLVRAEINVLSRARPEDRAPRVVADAEARLPGEQRGGGDDAFTVSALRAGRLADAARQEVINRRNPRRVGQPGSRALHRREAAERQKIIGDVRADLPMVEDRKPALADAVHDPVEATGDDERLERSGWNPCLDPPLPAGRADHDRLKFAAIEPLQHALQIAEKNSLVPVGDDKADSRLACAQPPTIVASARFGQPAENTRVGLFERTILTTVELQR